MDPANEFASRRAWRRSAEQLRKEAPQPAWPRSGADPAIQVRSIQLVHGQMKTPKRRIGCAKRSGFLNVTCPGSTKPCHFHDTRDAPAVYPIQFGFGYFQRLVQTSHRQVPSIESDSAVPLSGEWFFPLPLCCRSSLSGEFPTVVQLMPKDSREFNKIFHVMDVSLNADAARVGIQIVNEG